MKIFANFPHDLPAQRDFGVVTLGVFDGVHLGHQKILSTALELAAGKARVAVVTFDPHPRAVLGPPKRARLLSPLEERLQLLAHWPVDAVAVLRFDQQIARLPYDEFVRGALLEGLGARHLVLGYNVTIGRERGGTSDALTELGRRLGYDLTLVPAVEVEGRVVSSTLIRHRLDAGDVESAARFLGRPYDLAGTVVRGHGRGRTLGVPTANLELSPDKLLPANGVYAVRAIIGAETFGGALNIGVAPTFQADGPRSVEVHLLDFAGDLYGTRLRVELVRRLREERRFSGAEALLEQMRHDLEAARMALQEPPKVP